MLALFLAHLALTTPVQPASNLVATLNQLEHLIGAPSAADTASIAEAALAVCRELPGERGLAALPVNAQELSAAAAFFDWDGGGGLGQHLFDVSLWDDALEALARGLVDGDVTDAAAAVAASARFVMLDSATQQRAIEALAAAVTSDELLTSRTEALAAVRERRAVPQSEADAYAAARRRRRKNDFVAVAPETHDDERVIHALYECTVGALAE